MLFVGKSTISSLLRDIFTNSVKIDVDHFTGVNPPPDTTFGDTHYAFVARTLQAVVPHYQCEGYTNIFIPYVFERRSHLLSCIKALQKPGQQIFTFRLRGTNDTIAERVHTRSLGFSPHERDSRLDWEMKRFRELNSILDANSIDGALGEVVETDGREPSDIANGIADRLRFLLDCANSGLIDKPSSILSTTFATKYVDWILADRKTATTRRISSTTVIPNAERGNFASTPGNSLPFAYLWIHAIERMIVSNIDDNLARSENLESAEALVNELKLYYPDISAQSAIYVVKFTVQHFFFPRE